MMYIKAPAGAKALNVSKYSDAPNEKETLISRDSAFKVVKYDPKRRMLEVEMLSQGHDAVKGAGKSSKTVGDESIGDKRIEGLDKFTYNNIGGLIFFPPDDPDAESIDFGDLTE